MFRTLSVGLWLLLAVFALRLSADEQSDVRDLLSREVIGPKLALAEVQDFCEARVPRMPEITSREAWEKEADRLRREVLDKVVYRGQAAAWRDAKTKVEWLGQIEGGPGYRIKKLRYEALPGLWIPALLYEPEKLTGKVPVSLNVNGHDGNGKAATYKQLRCINQAKRGMIALNPEWLGMGQLRGDGFGHYRMNQLDLCGTSGLAPFYLAMKRGLDVLLAHEHADPKRVAVAGLSGGGWQTIIISSLDTRVTLANPVAGYSSFLTRVRNFSDLGDSEQTPCDLATVADYAHLTAMMAPRALLLTYNAKDDCCFASGHALPPLLAAARPLYVLYNREDRLRSHINYEPGTHNFLLDNRQALYRMLGDHFYDASTSFRPEEIKSDGEVKTAEQLQVDLPKGNANFQTLAQDLIKRLPKETDYFDQAIKDNNDTMAQRWQAGAPRRLFDVLRAKVYDISAKQTVSEKKGDTQATFWQLRMGGVWTVPAVELVRGSPKGTTILIADGGRKSAGEMAQKLLAAGQRVVAVDPFYFGESKIASHDFLFALLVSAVGERPLGIQASQLAAVARWLSGPRKLGPVTITSSGPRTSLMALVAAGLDHSAIVGVQLHGSYGSLKEIIEQSGSVDKTPELFCFGLLEKFDIVHLAALVAPREVVFHKASDRAKRELATLRDWYKLTGKDIDPLR
jgi:hypothetical protein